MKKMHRFLAYFNFLIISIIGLFATTLHAGTPIQCSVFDDGYTKMSAAADAVYFAGGNKACTPDGSPEGNCRKWFGRCTTTGSSPQPVKFRVFNDGYVNKTNLMDAVFSSSPRVSCIPDGTPEGDCRRWFGLPETDGGEKVQCFLFNDGYTKRIGPTNAIFYAGPGKVCTAPGQCRKWFGQCEVGGS